MSDLQENDYEEDKEDDPVDCTDNSDHEDADLSTITLPSGSTLQRRKRKKIIRYVHYNRKKDPENYYREALLLLYPWRDESYLINDCKTYEQRFSQVKEQIEFNRGEYELQYKSRLSS